MNVQQAIRKAESLLPGRPVSVGEDARWQAIIAVGKHIASEPEAVWRFVRRWGCHRQEDLRDAVATCLLEHLLEYHFSAYFPQVEELALADRRFAETFLWCSQFGQSKEKGNAKRFESLTVRLQAQRSS